MPSCALLKLKILDHVFVVKACCGLHFLFQKLESSLVEIGVVEAEDFEGVLSSVLSRTQLDLGAETLSESSADCK